MVRADVRERVEAAAQQLGYDGPDPRGRVLQDGKFNAIGFMPPGDYAIAEMIRSPYGRELVLGVSLACDEAGATLSLVNGTDETRTSTIRDALVDGFILGHSADIELITSAQRRRLPFVILESDAGPDINSIRIDGLSGALMAVETPGCAWAPAFCYPVRPAHIRTADRPYARQAQAHDHGGISARP